MFSFIEINGIRIDTKDEDVVKLGLGVADGSMKYDDVLSRINEHKKTLKID